MFEHVFHVIHLIMRASSTNTGLQGGLCKVFMEDAALDVKRQPHNFVENIFVPVATAMGRIFNWQEMQLPGLVETQ